MLTFRISNPQIHDKIRVLIYQENHFVKGTTQYRFLFVRKHTKDTCLHLNHLLITYKAIIN